MPAQVRLFSLRLLQVALLTAAMIALIFAAIGPDPDHYFAGSQLQLELLKNTPGPRIILVGGSNVSFGIDAELMQRTLGIPVINDGLHAGLGLSPLRELQDYLRDGDVVIISLEYQLFSSKDIMEETSPFYRTGSNIPQRGLNIFQTRGEKRQPFTPRCCKEKSIVK
jgi:hypothetical protein